MASNPAPRKRRYHHRSKNGCRSCKERHMRCDEGKPFCRNCLRNGGSCGYSVIRKSASNYSQTLPDVPGEIISGSMLGNSSPTLLTQSPVSSSFSFGMLDPFNTFPIEISPQSNMLLDHFNKYRILIREPIRKPPGDQMFAWAASDAALLHATLVLAAKHWMILGGSRNFIESTLYQHKTETIRLVNERLGDPITALSDYTVGAVGILIFVECLDQSKEAALIHLDGLEKMVNMRGDLHSPSMDGLLQRIILLADIHTANLNKSKPRFQKFQGNGNTSPLSSVPTAQTTIQPALVNNSFYKQIGLDPPLIKMFMDLNWLSFQLAKNDSTGGTDNISLASGITEAEKYIDTILRGGQYGSHETKGVVGGKAFIVLSGYIYLYLFLRRIEVSSKLYDWMLGLLKEDFRNVQHTMRHTCHPELLLWVLFVGANACVGRNELFWFKRELRTSRTVLCLKDWEDARAVLMKFAWVKGWKESSIERFWCELN